MSKFMYIKFKDQMEEARAVSYLGARSQITNNSFISQDDDFSIGLHSEIGPPHFGRTSEVA
jgi:hypothetical protein